MNVFRVENANGEGPFRALGMFDNWGHGDKCWSASKIKEKTREMVLGGGRPFPQADGFPCHKPFRGGVFGFKSLGQLADWFHDGDALPDGFHIIEYVAARAFEGHSQVYFLKGKKVRIVPWDEVRRGMGHW